MSPAGMESFPKKSFQTQTGSSSPLKTPLPLLGLPEGPGRLAKMKISPASSSTRHNRAPHRSIGRYTYPPHPHTPKPPSPKARHQHLQKLRARNHFQKSYQTQLFQGKLDFKQVSFLAAAYEMVAGNLMTVLNEEPFFTYIPPFKPYSDRARSPTASCTGRSSVPDLPARPWSCAFRRPPQPPSSDPSRCARWPSGRIKACSRGRSGLRLDQSLRGNLLAHDVATNHDDVSEEVSSLTHRNKCEVVSDHPPRTGGATTPAGGGTPLGDEHPFLTLKQRRHRLANALVGLKSGVNWQHTLADALVLDDGEPLPAVKGTENKPRRQLPAAATRSTPRSGRQWPSF